MKKPNFSTAVLMLTIVSSLLFSPVLVAQKLSDSAISKMSRVELGNYYMQKSKSQKTLGYTLLGAGLAAFTAGAIVLGRESTTDNNLTAGSILLYSSLIPLAASNPILCKGSKYKGKAEMLLRQPAANERPEEIKALASKYKSNAKASSIAAWTLFLGGLTGLFISAVDGSDAGVMVSAASMFASLPVWMNAAKNKGRVSILMGQESIPVSLNSGSSLRSIGISIPLTR